MERIFVDTNVFLYAASAAPEDARKKQLAAEVILRRGLVVSSQVIQEFISAALRRPALGLGEVTPEQLQEENSLIPMGTKITILNLRETLERYYGK